MKLPARRISMNFYEVTVQRENGPYSTMGISARNISECKMKALEFGEPVRIYYQSVLVWKSITEIHPVGL